jgi:hypothetical protein
VFIYIAEAAKNGVRQDFNFSVILQPGWWVLRNWGKLIYGDNTPYM